MRIAVTIAALAVFGLTCTFNAHPPSGVQACSNDDPPRCPDGYTCASGRCYKNGDLPDTGGSGGGASGSGGQAGIDVAACVPLTFDDCGKGAGKRCGSIPDGCNGTVECKTCNTGEVCQTNHICAVPCGGSGERCCANNKCTASDTICLNNACAACGGVGQPCCANDDCTAAGASCVESPAAPLDAGTTDKVCLPACVSTTTACTPGTDQDCFSQCGPGKIGVEGCTCGAAATTGSTPSWKCPTCSFAASTDFPCYQLPATVPACDPNTPPTMGTRCTAAACTPCGSATGKGYLDTSNNARAGFCICANSLWNCAPTKQWPCPGNPGC